MEHRTGIFDRSGKEIYVGDVIQTRLGNHAKKSGGPSASRVIRFHKNVELVDTDKDEYPYGGRRLTEQVAKNSVIIYKEIFR